MAAPGSYRGAAGGTRATETMVWCGGCGARFGARLHLSIDAKASPGRLSEFVAEGYRAINLMTCPACAWEHVAEAALLVHRPEKRRLFLVVPEASRHLVMQLRAEALRDVAANPGEVVPAYALEPELVFGPKGLADAMRRPMTGGLPVTPQRTKPLGTPAPEPPEAEAETSAERSEPQTTPAPSAPPPVVAPPAPPKPLPPPATPPPEVAAAPDTVHPAPTLAAPPTESLDASADISVEMVTPEVEAESSSKTAPLPSPADSAEISVNLDESADAPPPRPPVPGTPGAKKPSGGLLADLIKRRSEPPPPPVPVESSSDWDSSVDEGWMIDTASTKGRDEDPTHVVRVEDVAERTPSGPKFDEGLALGAETYVELTEEGVHAVVRLDAERAAAFEEGDSRVLFQLHQPKPGPVAALAVTLHVDGESTDHLFWTLDPDRACDAEVLDALGKNFVVEGIFHTPDGFHGRRSWRQPLERNVRSAMAIVREAGGSPKAAREAVTAPNFDRLGRLQHNFHRASFEVLRNASEARLAVGILSYWSAPERRDYLLRVKAFPETWFEQLVRRVLEGALYYGLAMEPHLRQRALELQLAQNSSGLLRTCLANFAEVNLNLKPSELDALDIWDNWEALLAHAEELDLRVDEDIEELAATAMERAREAALAPEPLELDADDASIDVEEVGELTELSDVDLVGLLQDPRNRLEATLSLLNRGDPVYVPTVFDAIKVMSREELLRAVPAALALGPAFEAHFLTALRSRRISLKLASALFLAEIRSERASAPVLAMISKANDGDWPVLARAAARMGRRILGAALREVEVSGDEGGRIAETLALLGADARGALSAARDQQNSKAVRETLSAAIGRIGEVSFGDAADFGERLADAFAAAGADEVGPDFEEELESVDLGPGANLGLETDVDLNGLNE